MAITFSNFDNYLNTVLDLYVKENPVGQNIQNKPFLKARQEKSKPFVGGADYISLPVQMEYMNELAGWGQWYSHVDQVSYVHPDNIRRAKYAWREAHVGATLSFTELKQRGVEIDFSGKTSTRGSAREVQIVKDWIKNVLEDDFGESLSRFMNDSLWLDGSQSAKAIVGLSGVIDDDPTVGTVGGLDRATFSAWRHYIKTGIAVSPENSTLINELNKGFIQQSRYGGMPDEMYAGSDFIDGLRRELIAKGLLTQTGFNQSGQINVGVADIPFKNMILRYDPWLDDHGRSKQCLVLDSRHVKWMPMQNEGMRVQRPERPYDQYVLLKAVTITGALCFDQLNCHGLYAIA